jgi:pimeloyl-ACP methyl ester carboxylesterase
VALAVVAAALPHADRYVFAGAGHVPHATHPEQYVDVLGAFLARAERYFLPTD